MAVHGVLFDLGGVLIDWNPRHLYTKLLPDQDDRIDYFLANICPLEWNEQQDAGRSLATATDERARQFPDWEPEIRAYYSRWKEMIGGEIPGTAVLAGELAASGVRLFALSNWSLETFPLVRDRFSFLSLFEKIFLSGEYGMAKPDPRFYRKAIEQTGLPVDQLLFVDDNPRNVFAAEALGLRSTVFKSATQLRGALAEMGLTQGAIVAPTESNTSTAPS